MVFIITALLVEATPIIQYFKLKKDMNIHAYQVYRNSEMALIISGVGKIKSAMAAMYLCSVYHADKQDILMNIGFCGTNNIKYQPGDMLIINKVTDMDTGYDYYPDIYYSADIPQENIRCYSTPVLSKDHTNEKMIVCDMESAGIMEAAKKITYAHNVIILKIISDYLTPENLDKGLLQNYIRKQLPKIEDIIHEVKQMNRSLNEISLKDEKEALDALSEKLKFSESMKQMLLKKIKKAKLQGLNPLNILESSMNMEVNSKTEGKKIFEQISKKFEEMSI